MQTILKLPILHPKQGEIYASPFKRKVLVEGRQFGKTTLFAYTACQNLLYGKRVIEAAPIAKQTNAFWKRCKHYLHPLIIKGIIRKNETDRTLEMGTGFIQAQTAYDADSLRGDNADLLLLDEYSYMDKSAWEIVGAPMLVARNGSAMFAFTPNRRNHAYHLYNRALDNPEWEIFHGTTYDNPHIPREAIDRMIGDMTEDMVRQEIMAEFLEGEGAVFRNIKACMNAQETTPGAHKGHNIVAGVDWAKQSDFTCISVGCKTCKSEIVIDRFNQIDYKVQRDRIKLIVEKWGVRELLVERNSIGEPNLEMLVRDGLPARGFNTTATSKPPLIENLALALERAEWQFIDDPLWSAELEAYERRINANTGRPSYSAPEGLHDDTVMARALMLHLATSSVGVLFEV